MWCCLTAAQSGGIKEHLWERHSWFCSTKALCQVPELKGFSSQL